MWAATLADESNFVKPMQLYYMSKYKISVEEVSSLYLNAEIFSSMWPKREKIIWRKDRWRMYTFQSSRNVSHTKVKPAEARFNWTHKHMYDFRNRQFIHYYLLYSRYLGFAWMETFQVPQREFPSNIPLVTGRLSSHFGYLNEPLQTCVYI